MRPGEVLDAQGDLLERLGNPEFCRTVDALGEFEYGRSGGRLLREGTDSASDLVRNCTKAAYAYRVTADMSLLVQHAADGLDGLDRFDSSLAPTQTGFVAFDRPLPMVDVRGKVMLISFLLWGPVGTNLGPATAVYAFNDMWKQPDEVVEELRQDMGPERFEDYQRTCGRWATVGWSAYHNDQRLGPQRSFPSEAEAAQLLAEGSTPSAGTNMIRYVHALWLMMNQTVAKVEGEQVDRTSRRRAERRRLPSKVTVIRLRREQGAAREDGESLVEWAHRWVVRGHWRWQVVGERHPLAQEVEPGKFRARIWINPFVKGPEGAPFVQSEKVYSLER